MTIFGLLACHAPPETCTACTIADAQNYTYEAELSAAVAPVAALTDVSVEWSGLTQDLQGHALSPSADIGSARLVAFRGMTPAEVAEGLANDDLEQAAVSLYLVCTPLDRSCLLSEFSIGGSAVDASDYTEPDVGAWLVALSRPQEPGAAALIFLDPQADTMATAVSITSDTSHLDVQVDLQTLAPLPVTAEVPTLTLDWSGLTVDGLGNALSLDGVDGLFIGRYDLPIARLQERVFDLYTLSDDLWSADVTGLREVALADLAGPRPFPGVDADGTWLLALTCSTCTNPAPRFLTVLQGY